MICHTDIHAFRMLQNEWRSLQKDVANIFPFRIWEWLFSWWQAYSHGKKLRLLIWRRVVDQKLVAIVPLYLMEEKVLGINCPVLRFVGEGSFDSDYLDFIIAPDVFPQVVCQLGEWLQNNNEWDVLLLRDMHEKSPLHEILKNFATQQDLRIRVEYGRYAAVELSVSFDQFLQKCRPRFRTKLRSLLRDFEKDETLVFEEHASPQSLRRKLRSLFALHQQRWQQLGQSGVFNKKSKRIFYAHFATKFARNGWLRLYSLRREQRYLAHQLCFGTNGVTYLLQEGFDVSESTASYGQMLRALVFKHLIETGDSRYDFLGGFSDHKADWGAEPGKIIHLVLAKENWRGRLYFGFPLWREALITQVKRLVRPRPKVSSPS